jgi:hypothetical protein
MNQALYAHINNKRKRKKNKDLVRKLESEKRKGNPVDKNTFWNFLCISIPC